jgi:hypothetical protein
MDNGPMSKEPTMQTQAKADSYSAGTIAYRRNGVERRREVFRAIVRGQSELVDGNGRVLRIEGRELKCNGRCIGIAPVFSSYQSTTGEKS